MFLFLPLPAVGTYGVISYSASRRTHEIGVRMSLGATRSDVSLLVLRQGMWLAVAGSVTGMRVEPIVALRYEYSPEPTR